MTEPDEGASPPIAEPSASRRGWLWILLALAVVVVLGTIASRTFYGDRPHRIYELGGPTMGTRWSLKVSLPEGAPDAWVGAIGDTVQARLDRIEDLMSTWDTTSELSRFNRSADTSATPLSPETIEVLVLAEEIRRQSGGALDVTVGPLVAAWGFGPGEGSEPGPPSSAVRDSLQTRIGPNRLRVDAGDRTASKAVPGVAVDVSAVAKGYALDRAAEGVVRMGAADFALEVGGEVRARGVRPDGVPWRVAVETPDPDARTVFRVLDLGDEAVATSGDYRNFYEADGVRYGHIIDPRSGLPVRWKGFSVTVLHREAARADAWATALSVIGPEEGLELARSLGLTVLFVVPAEGGGYEALYTADLADRMEP